MSDQPRIEYMEQAMRQKIVAAQEAMDECDRELVKFEDKKTLDEKDRKFKAKLSYNYEKHRFLKEELATLYNLFFQDLNG